MHRFQQAYECGDLEIYRTLFTLDFQFLSNDPRFLEEHPQGIDRDQEIEVARHLFEGHTNADGTHEPLAVHIEVRIDPLVVSLDPTAHGPPDRFQVVTSGAVRLSIDQGGGAQLVTIGDRHEFHVVRGEGAMLGAGQRADADHWYIWKWVEHVELQQAWESIRMLYR